MPNNGGVSVRPVRTRSDKKKFLRLPWRLYESDPQWVPPLLYSQRGLVAYAHHPFYDDAEVQTFLAECDGRVCGRIAAIVNHGHNRKFDDRLGFFGFFEAEDNQQVASALFDAAGDWLASQEMTSIRGPCNPSINYECGLLIEGCDSPPTFMMTYNPPYYQRLVEEYGFVKSQDLFTFCAGREMMDSVDPKVPFIIEEFQRRFDIKFRPLDVKRFDDDVRLFLRLYNDAMAGHWGFSPLSEAEVKHLSGELKHVIIPELTSFAEHDGRVVAALLTLPDINATIRKMNGRLFPFGIFTLLRNRRKVKRARLVATVVAPEFQRWGLGPVVQANVLPRGLELGMEEAEFSWVAESNQLSAQTLRRGGLEASKTHRLYDYAIKP